LCKSQKDLEGDPTNDWANDRGRKYGPYEGVWRENRKLTEIGKSETAEGQSHEHAHIFFDIKGIFHKAFVLAGQTVNSA
jgi:hypothetical protein